ncbi:ninja-family protein AFP3-like [Argentina anserina]|uniref:ninja-family protein AFP3-like n=1 Tax=Argentina anserina TaxID=57926 RepID=UPI0021765727|nr:ninja-family protein AFP3-like [Potentilla anserina]
MPQTEEGCNRATRPLFTIPASNLQGDLFRRVVSGNDISQEVVVDEPVEDSDDVELSLGLSLNGRFGVDPRAKAGLHLKRSSSISDFSPAAAASMTAAMREEEATTSRVPRPFVVPLMRTCSLPTETEDEWRKRKELQSLRRMEAKRKRSEKQQRSYSKLHRVRSRENFEVDSRLAEAFNVGGCPRLPPAPPPESQGTMGSQGSGSSVVTESDSQAAAQVVQNITEARSDSNIEPLPKSGKEQLVAPRVTGNAENLGQLNGVVQMQNHCNKSASPPKGPKEIVRNVLENMPSVFTKGDGPDGRRVEGFLYRYKKGEEVRIVCVCHGSFLTPAEFVKHAGGGEVPHPLKHIVVNPSPIL